MVKVAFSRNFSLFFAIITSCSESRDLHDVFGVPKNEYNDIVLILDSGCSSCKSKFYEFVEAKWPENNALIIRGPISQETKYHFETMLMRDFVFLDSNDIAHSKGKLGKNVELALLKDGKLLKYSYLEYEEMIRDFNNF